MNRRSFIKLGTSLAATGLVVGIGWRYRYPILFKVQDYLANKDFDPSAFISIPSAGKIKIICHRSEMGQGVRTSIPMILAEELEVELAQIEVIQALGDPKYGDQNTDGSKSIRDFYYPLRRAAAGVRLMLLEAGAQHFGVKIDECKTEKGQVILKKSNQAVSYQDLTKRAALLDFPKQAKLKNSKSFNFIGKEIACLDLEDYVTGKAHFGIDVDFDQLLVSCLVRSPVPGGKIKHFDATQALKVSGVSEVIKLEAQGPDVNTNESIAVVASNTWAAIKAKKLIKVEWDNSGQILDNTDSYGNKLEKSLARPGTVYRAQGKKNKKYTYSSTYHTPYLVHAPMEPMVASAWVKKDSCEVWAPCQDPQRSMKAISKLLGMDKNKITFHVTFLGGGFGRKSQPDFILEAVLLSKKIGRPVKVQWTREDEIQHGFYHAQSMQKISATVDDKGYPSSWYHQAVFPTIMSVFIPQLETPQPWESEMGASNLPYQIKNIHCEVAPIKSSVRIGWLRSVCNIWHSFAVNSFIDELAFNAKIDPIEYRLKLLDQKRIINPKEDFAQDTGRLYRVIEKTRDLFNWKFEKSSSVGFASHFSFKSYVAMAMEAVVEKGVIVPKKATLVIDCGQAVNVDSVKAQMQGSIIFGLSAAMYGKITLKEGVVEQSNFHDNRVLRLNETPLMDIHIINGAPDHPTGVGEPGVPVVAPALAAALFKANGKRLKTMPFAEQI